MADNDNKAYQSQSGLDRLEMKSTKTSNKIKKENQMEKQLIVNLS